MSEIVLNQSQETLMEKDKVFTFNSFFAGIGGFDLALESEGFSPSFQCEINAFCGRVLKKHWPNVPLGKDITKLAASEIPEAEVWCGGFPCQDVSVARGSKGRDGLKGKNSGLFFPFSKLIESKRPKVLLIENVTGLLSSHNGQDFRIILETLSGFGYMVAWRVMNSRYFGAPQSRPRVFICAAHQDAMLALSTLYETARGTKPKNKRKSFLTPSECEVTGAKVAGTAYCLAATSGRHTGTDWSRTYVSYESAVRRMTPIECEGLQGFPPRWTDVPCPSSETDSDIDTPRYHALGNAVAVPVIKWIAKKLMSELSAPNRRKSSFMINGLLERFNDFSDSSLRSMKLSELHLATKANGSSLKWQNGGLVVGDDCWDIKAPEAPSLVVEKKLIDVIERQIPADKYFLSPNAAEGILRRVYSQNRTLFGPMDEALNRMIKQNKVA